MTAITVKVTNGVEDSDAVHVLTFRSRVLRAGDDDAIVTTRGTDLNCPNGQEVTINLAQGPWEVIGLNDGNTVKFGEPIPFSVGSSAAELRSLVNLADPESEIPNDTTTLDGGTP